MQSCFRSWTAFFQVITEYSELTQVMASCCCQSFIQRVIEILQEQFGSLEMNRKAVAKNPVLTQQQLEKRTADASAGSTSGLRYASGYVIKKLYKKYTDPETKAFLFSLEKGEEEDEENEWFITKVDRGGLIKVNNKTFKLLGRIHDEYRKQLKIDYRLTHEVFLNVILHQQDILLMWAHLCQTYKDEGLRVLKDAVKAVAGISGRAFAKSATQSHRITAKKIKQTNSLRKSLQNITNVQ